MPGFLDAVIFDMDGVLCDSEPFIRQAATQMLHETYRLNPAAEDFAPFVGTGEDRFIGGVAEKYGVALTMPRDKQRVYTIYLNLIRGRLQPLPGAVQFIARCRALGMKLAVASSADRIKVDGNLNQISLPATGFDALVTGSDVERKKPDPQVFLAAAAKLGLKPNRCLVVEDAPGGIAAGKAAGCRVLGLTTSFTAAILIRAGADFIAVDLSDVPPVVIAARD